MKIVKILTYKGVFNFFSALGLTAISPLGPKIGARNDRYYTTWSENRRPE